MFDLHPLAPHPLNTHLTLRPPGLNTFPLLGFESLRPRGGASELTSSRDFFHAIACLTRVVFGKLLGSAGGPACRRDFASIDYGASLSIRLKRLDRG